jgi:phosphoglycolate phosphatase
MPEIRNVILDWSGTLADDFTPVLDATNEIFRHHGKPAFTAEAFREKFYLPFPAFYKEYLPELVIEDLDVHYRDIFRNMQHGISLLSHSLDFLEYLRGRNIPTFWPNTTSTPTRPSSSAT